MNSAQILTADQMRAAEQALFDTGISQFELMQTAARGAAEWIRRIAAGRSITVLCGPGNNGGDGYVIAHLLQQAGNPVQLVAPIPPKTETAEQVCELWASEILTSGGEVTGEVLVDCLFGSGLSRPLSGEHALLLRDLAARHSITIAIDVPSGIASDSGAALNDRLPSSDATLALGAWKFAHWAVPGRLHMGERRLVPIGVAELEGAAQLVTRPKLSAPPAHAHKYTRGLAAIVGGDMAGAALLAAQAAARSGAGYVKLIRHECEGAPADLVIDPSPLKVAGADERIRAMLIGPGLGRHDGAIKALETVLSQGHRLVLDADALVVLKPHMLNENAILATPHDGELEHLCRSFSIVAEGRLARAQTLASVSGMVICAKGPDTMIAAPDGRLAIASPAPSWLSVAGSGDVLAGIAVSRMATGCDPFEAACEAVWLHGEAARICGPAFTPSDLAHAVTPAIGRCL